MNYLYNGVELPYLPEWDWESYPYAVIQQLNSRWFQVWATKELPYVSQTNSGWYMFFSSGSLQWDNYTGEGVYVNEWLYKGEIGAYEQVASSFIWSNHDILNEDGTLYLAASDPVPVTTIDPESLLMGYLVGCALRSQKGKTITGYSYNGVVLPALPEWDKETYPYAYIVDLTQFGVRQGLYRLIVSDTELQYSGWKMVGENVSRTIYFYDSTNAIWGSPSQYSASSFSYEACPIWANTDVYSNGSVYLAASDPVPVYA